MKTLFLKRRCHHQKYKSLAVILLFILIGTEGWGNGKGQNSFDTPVKLNNGSILFKDFNKFEKNTNPQRKIVVTGTITEEGTNIPIPGANIVEQGTTNGVMSDFNGNYIITVADDSELVISFVGFATQMIPVNGLNKIDISMKESAEALDEVVVIGYGQTTRKNLTTAQISVKAESIENTVNTSVEQALQGRAAGVVVVSNSGQPGGSFSVNIRGISTINGTQEPLYVIDGVQIQPGLSGFGATSSSNPLANLNPGDIENMEVLQGPSATAIYGTRASNGVILITTKRGKEGKAQISYDFTYALQLEPEFIPLLNLKDWALVSNELRKAYGQGIPPEYQDPSILGEGTNWQEAIFRNAPLAKHQLSLQGGSKSTKYYFSAENMDQEGVAFGSEFKRTSIRLNLDNSPTKWLDLGFNLAASQTDEDLGATQNEIIKLAMQIPPYIPVKNPDGSWGGYPEGLQPELSLQNPLALANLISNTQQRRQFTGGVNATVKLLPGLQFRTNLNTTVGADKVKNWIPTYELGARSNTEASLTKKYSDNFYWNWSQILEYRKDFNEVDISVMAGHESQEGQWEGLSGMRSVFPLNELPGGFIPSLSMGNQQGMNNSDYRGWFALESYFARLGFNYDEKYFATFAMRRDGHTYFSDKYRWGNFPSTSFAWRVIEEPFMKEVSFISDLKLRLESGVTGNPGFQTGRYAPLKPVSTGFGTGFITSQFDNPNLRWEETMTYNYGIDLGLFKNRISLNFDYYVRNTNNMIMALSVPEFYGTNSQLYGIDPPAVNIGKMQNKGVTLTVNTINIQNENFRWTTNFNISHNKPIVKEFFTNSSFYELDNWNAGGNFRQRSVEGQAPFMFYGWQYDGLFQTLDEINNSAVPDDGNGNRIATSAVDGVWVGDVKWKDLNNDGLINEKDRNYMGSPYPDFTYGMTNTLNWKGLELMVLITGSQGNQIYNAMRFSHLDIRDTYGGGTNLYKEATDYARFDGSTLLNPDAHFPRFPAGGNGNWSRATNLYVEDGSFLRIKNVALSYRLPRSLLDKIPYVDGFRIGLGIQNLYTFTNYSGYDPEIGADVGANSDPSRRTIGVDVGRYPQTKMYNLNIGIDF